MALPRGVAFFFAMCAFAAFQALAQPYPGRPIRMIGPSPSASLPDIVGRALGQSLSQTFGQPVVADNRVGANGNIAMEACAKSAPDGYSV